MSSSSSDSTIVESNDAFPLNDINIDTAQCELTSSESLEARLFKPSLICVHGYSEVISLIAPRVDRTKKWDSSDASLAYCTKCKIKLKWSQKNPKQVRRHVARCHGELLRENKASSIGAPNKLENFFYKKPRKDLPTADKGDQLKGEVLLVKWVAESLRPFTIVDDIGFCDYTNFLCNLNKQFSIPSRKKLRRQLVHFGEFVKQKMKDKLNQDVKYFGATTDIWSSRTMESYMAITLQALTQDFDMINLTLAVEPLHERHTGDVIRQHLEQSFTSWNLDHNNLTMMLRDNASNVLKACRDWGIPHFGCIGHTLHLIVGPLFVQNSHESMEIITDTDECTLDDECLNDIADYNEDELLIAVNNFDTRYREKVQHIKRISLVLELV
jgi:hypothetical protein